MSDLPATTTSTLPAPANTGLAPSDFFLPQDLETPRFLYLETNVELGIKRDPIHDRMKNHPFYGKRIQLRSTYGKTAQPVHMEPSHPRGQDTVWLGIPRITKDAEAIMHEHGFALAIPGETFIKAGDGYEVDCGTEQGLYLWEWLQFAPQIITDTDKYDASKPHEGADKELYVLIPADEEKKRTQEFVDRKIASDWLFTQSPRRWYDIARLIGSGMDQGKESDVFNYLMDVSQRTPDRIISVKNDNQADLKLLVKRLIDRGIIQQSDGMYRYNSAPLGTSEQQVLDYVQMERNGAIVSYMKSQLGADGGLSGTPVNTSYASYESPAEQQVRQAAQQESSTLGYKVPTYPPTAPVVPVAPVLRAPVPLATDAAAQDGLSNEELDDDYMDDSTADALLSTAEKNPNALADAAAATAAAAPAVPAAPVAPAAAKSSAPRTPPAPKN